MSKNNICNSDSLLLDMKPMQIKTKTARNTPPRICHLCLAEYGTLEGGLISDSFSGRFLKTKVSN